MREEMIKLRGREINILRNQHKEAYIQLHFSSRTTWNSTTEPVEISNSQPEVAHMEHQGRNLDCTVMNALLGTFHS